MIKMKTSTAWWSYLIYLSLQLGQGFCSHCLPAPAPNRSTFDPASFTMVKDDGGQTVVLGPRGETWAVATDFDDDCDTDILAGNGGHVYLLENKGDAEKGQFAAPRKLTKADGTTINMGYWSGAPAYKDMNGDGLKDLLLSEWDGALTPLSLFINVGTSTEPAFAEPRVLLRTLGGSGIRFDVADWDGDGLNDVIVGPNKQPFAYYPNEGTAASPRIKELPVLIQKHYSTIRAHFPRVVDWSGEGDLKILYSGYFASSGVNLLTVDTVTKTETDLRLLDRSADIQDKVGYRLSADIADFNGDGIADIVISGKSGKLVIFWGKDMNKVTQQYIGALDAILTQYSTNLGEAMESSDEVCDDLQVIQDALLKIANHPTHITFKENFFARLAALVNKHPQYLKRQRFSSPYLTYFSFYTWIIMLEGRDDTRENRLELAEVTNQTGYVKDVLVERGVVFLDNDQSSELALRLLRDYTLSLRPEYFSVERIRSKQCAADIDWARYTYKEMRKGGLSIFCSGEASSTKKAMLPGCKVCHKHGNPNGNSFVSVIAHEIGHNFVETARLRSRKFSLIRRALQRNPDIFWQNDDRYDETKTKTHFTNRGWYDASTDDWSTVIQNYFKGKYVPEAAETQYQIITNSNPGYVGLTNTKEFFASLAQCFSIDAKMLMDIAIERFLGLPSYKESINQILYLIEYYSLGGGTSRFWMHTQTGRVYFYDVILERNAQGHIVGVIVPKDVARKVDDPGEAYLVDLPTPHIYVFKVDGEGYVTAIVDHPSYINL